MNFSFIPHIALEVNADGLNLLLSNPDLVSYVDEDSLFKPLLNESVPFIHADTVRSQGFDGQGWVVAILDTGVKRDHEFLSGKVIDEACYSTNLCPDGEGYVSQTGKGAADPGRCSNIKGCDHGTHVAGIAAGYGGSTIAQGVAPGANIIAIQVFSTIENPDECDEEDQFLA